MAIYVKGIVENIVNRTTADGKVFLRVYQIASETSGGLKGYTNIDDFDIKRKVEIGKEITLPIYCEIRIPETKDGKKMSPVLQYRAFKENEAKLLPNDPTKKAA